MSGPKRTMAIPRKRATPRTWRCPHCLGRISGTIKTCSTCKVRRGTKRTSLKARCDSLARELCRTLAQGVCARCGGPGSDWAHRAARRHHSVRWSMDNCDFLCRKCHRDFTDHPFAFTAWLVARGVDVDALERRASVAWDKDYSRVLAELVAQLKMAKEKAA